MTNVWKYSLLMLLLIVVCVWLAVFTFSSKTFRLITCDVGQGDAILAAYGSYQLLTDGGLPNNKVVECLSRHMPFWDRNIEVVVSTHPDKDHYGGLIDVFQGYNVQNFVVSGLNSSSQEYQLLLKAVQNEGSRVAVVRGGQSIRLGLMHLDIVHPIDIPPEPKKTNDFSIVSILSFGEFNVLLTGDIEDKASDEVAERLINSPSHHLSFELLKVPHHGSKNGLSQKLFDVVNPQLAVISLGKNSYGHPHEEVMKMLDLPAQAGENEIKILRTDLLGDIVIESDGKSWKIVN